MSNLSKNTDTKNYEMHSCWKPISIAIGVLTGTALIYSLFINQPENNQKKYFSKPNHTASTTIQKEMPSQTITPNEYIKSHTSPTPSKTPSKTIKHKKGDIEKIGKYNNSYGYVVYLSEKEERFCYSYKLKPGETVDSYFKKAFKKAHPKSAERLEWENFVIQYTKKINQTIQNNPEIEKGTILIPVVGK